MSLITLPHGVYIIDTSGSEKGTAANPLVVNAGTGSVVVSQTTAANLNATVTGSVAVINFPATQTITGTVAGTGNFTVVQSTAANLNATVTGSVGITNFPAVQTVTGTVVVNAGAGAFNVTGAVAQGTAAALTGRWPVIITDGTNIKPVGDVAARAGYIRVTDGTNVMPVGDVVARSAFSQISDGITGPVAEIGRAHV